MAALQQQINDPNAQEVPLEAKFLQFIANLAEKSKSKYKNAVRDYKSYCIGLNLNESSVESLLLYLKKLRSHEDFEFKATTCWTICSTIASWFLHVHNIGVYNDLPALKNTLKSWAKLDTVKKSAIFEDTDFNKFLNECEDDDYWLVKKAIAVTSVMGFLRKSEIVTIKWSDIIDSNYAINFENVQRGKQLN